MKYVLMIHFLDLQRFVKNVFFLLFFSFFNQKMCLQHPLWQQMNHTSKLNSKRFFFFSDFLILIKKLTFVYKRVYLNNFNRSHVTQIQKKPFLFQKEKMDFFSLERQKGRVLCSAGYLLSNYCCLDIDQWNVPIPFYVSLYFLVKNLDVSFSFS